MYLLETKFYPYAGLSRWKDLPPVVFQLNDNDKLLCLNRHWERYLNVRDNCRFDHSLTRPKQLLWTRAFTELYLRMLLNLSVAVLFVIRFIRAYWCLRKIFKCEFASGQVVSGMKSDYYLYSNNNYCFELRSCCGRCIIIYYMEVALRIEVRVCASAGVFISSPRCVQCIVLNQLR